MITGVIGATSSFAGRIFYPDFFNGRILAFFVSIACIVVYVTVSLLDKQPDVDLDEILNRKKDKVSDPGEKRKLFRFKPEVPTGDRILLSVMAIAITGFVSAFIGCWIYNSIYEVPTEKWVNFWPYFLYTMFALATGFLVWILIGGVRDLIRMFRSLSAQEVDIHDDGSVEDHHAAGQS